MPAPVGAVVVGVDRQQRVGAELGRALGQMHGMAGVVGAHAGDDRAAALHLLDGEGDHAQVLLVGQRRGLAGRAADTSPSEPCSTRWCISRTAASSSTRPSASNGVTIAVRIAPRSTAIALDYRRAGAAAVRASASPRALSGAFARPRRAPPAGPSPCSTRRAAEVRCVCDRGPSAAGRPTCVTGAPVSFAIRSGRPACSHFENAHRQRRDDDLVVALRIPGVGHRDHRVGVADAARASRPASAQLLERLPKLLRGRLAAPSERRRGDDQLKAHRLRSRRGLAASTSSSSDVAVTLATTRTFRFQVIPALPMLLSGNCNRFHKIARRNRAANGQV